MLGSIVTGALLAIALGLRFAILRQQHGYVKQLLDCSGVVKQPEPGGGASRASWQAHQESLANQVAAADAGQVRLACKQFFANNTLITRGRNAGCAGMQGLDIVFYGDSITENLNGTALGRPWPGGKGTGEVYQKHFGAYKSAILAIAGAPFQCKHKHKVLRQQGNCHCNPRISSKGRLPWFCAGGILKNCVCALGIGIVRCAGAQGPVSFQGKAPRVAMIMIGTNDLCAADCHRNAAGLLAAVPGIMLRCVVLPQTHYSHT